MKRLMATALVLMMTATLLFAASAEDLYSQFSDALDAGDASKAIDIYGNLQEKVRKDYMNAERSYEKAVDAGNFAKARQIMGEIHEMNAAPYLMTEEDSALMLLRPILSSRMLYLRSPSLLLESIEKSNPFLNDLKFPALKSISIALLQWEVYARFWHETY